MLYGKLRSAVILEQLVSQDNKNRAKVGSIIQEFNVGLSFISSTDNKHLYKNLNTMWRNETKNRIGGSALPEKVKNYLITTVIGLSKNNYCQTMIDRNWVSEKQKCILLRVMDNHNKNYMRFMKNAG